MKVLGFLPGQILTLVLAEALLVGTLSGLLSAGLAYVIWFFFGLFGGHRFYLGQGGLGAAMFLTLGGFGIWALIDVALIGGAVREVNARRKAEIFGRAGLPVIWA